MLWDPVPRQGTEPGPSALGAQNLSHWKEPPGKSFRWFLRNADSVPHGTTSQFSGVSSAQYSPCMWLLCRPKQLCTGAKLGRPRPSHLHPEAQTPVEGDRQEMKRVDSFNGVGFCEKNKQGGGLECPEGLGSGWVSQRWHLSWSLKDEATWWRCREVVPNPACASGFVREFKEYRYPDLGSQSCWAWGSRVWVFKGA